VLKYHCFRCPTCRAVDRFCPNPKVDVAIAALKVSCPYVDRAAGSECVWTGRLENFAGHDHIFEDHQHQQSEPRGTKRRRPEDAENPDAGTDHNQAETASPPSKVFRLGPLSISLCNYGLHVDRQGIHFHAEANVTSNSPPPNPAASPQWCSPTSASSSVIIYRHFSWHFFARSGYFWQVLSFLHENVALFRNFARSFW